MTFSLFFQSILVGMSNYRLVVILFAVILVAGLYYLIHWTRTGRNMRAVEEDRVAAILQGVNANRINALVFALGVGLAGTAGALIAPLYAITPSMGGMPLLCAYGPGGSWAVRKSKEMNSRSLDKGASFWTTSNEVQVRRRSLIIELALRPTCAIWATIFAPCSWTISATSLKPGIYLSS